jgi:hypothetical protein
VGLEKENMDKDQYEEVHRGQYNLEEMTAAAMLRQVASLLEQAPVEADPVIELDFQDRWGELGTVEIRLKGAQGELNTVN